jgi:stearoyl-CoA desaturase (Delta-9 desaturase)
MKPVANFKLAVLATVFVPFLGTILAVGLLWHQPLRWSDVVLLGAMYALPPFGMTLGYHRMLTQRSFQGHPAVKVILLILGSMAVEGPPLPFAATHIKHHAHPDREGDPHSPMEGFFHAHVGWLFKDRFADPQVYCRHLLKDPLVVWVDRTFPLWVALSLGIPFLLGGWTGLLWGGLVRIFIGHQISFSVNSICHIFGKRDFETNDGSRNQWLVGFLAYGEGWHNNHHAFPRAAFYGMHWWQIDMGGYVIWLLERLHLVHDVYRVPATQLVRYSSCSASPVAVGRDEKVGAESQTQS